MSWNCNPGINFWYDSWRPAYYWIRIDKINWIMIWNCTKWPHTRTYYHLLITSPFVCISIKYEIQCSAAMLIQYHGFGNGWMAPTHKYLFCVVQSKCCHNLFANMNSEYDDCAPKEWNSPYNQMISFCAICMMLIWLWMQINAHVIQWNNNDECEISICWKNNNI